MEMSAQVQTSSLTSRLYIDQILLPTTQVAILEICSKLIWFFFLKDLFLENKLYFLLQKLICLSRW